MVVVDWAAGIASGIHWQPTRGVWRIGTSARTFLITVRFIVHMSMLTSVQHKRLRISVAIPSSSDVGGPPDCVEISGSTRSEYDVGGSREDKHYCLSVNFLHTRLLNDAPTRRIYETN